MECLVCDSILEDYTYSMYDGPYNMYLCPNTNCHSMMNLYENDKNQITFFTFKLIIKNCEFLVSNKSLENQFIIYKYVDGEIGQKVFGCEAQTYDKNIFAIIDRFINLLAFD